MDPTSIISELPFYAVLFFISFLFMRGTLGIPGSIGVALVIALSVRGLVILLAHPKLSQSKVDRFLKDVHVIGHRGCTVEAPENTLAAIRAAHKHGVRAVEIDVEFSADGQGVILHDSTLERTTNGKGAVGEKTLNQLKSLNPSIHHPLKDQFKTEKIPTLEEALQLAKQLNLTVFLDIKATSPMRMARTLQALYQKDPQLFDKVAVCSFYPNVVYIVRWYLQDLVTGLTHRPNLFTAEDMLGTKPRTTGWSLSAAQGLDIIWEQALYYFWTPLCGNSLFLMNDGVVSLHEVSYWAKRGIRILVWTVNDVYQKHYLRYNVHVPYMTDEVSKDKNFP